MLPKIENIKKSENESFYVGKYCDKWFDRTWHYHSEFELLLITKGYGVRVVGNNRVPFEEGDLVLVGGNIPHAWFSDPVFFEEDNDLECESIYVQFNRTIFGNRFINIPEMKPIRRLLDEARHGLEYISKSDIIKQEIMDLPKYKGIDRLLKLIQILWMFKTGEYKTILPDDYLSKSLFTKSARINKVIEFVIKNYMHDIKIEDVAQLVEMNMSSFCRFFKRMTNRTFSQYVKEVRIDYAQQLLINTNLRSNVIGFECGFSSVVYFNQCFKSMCNMSPLEYRTAYRVL